MGSFETLENLTTDSYFILKKPHFETFQKP